MIDERVGMALSGLSSCASAALGSRYRFGTQETTDADGGDALPSTAEGATVLEGQFLWCVSKGWYTPHRGRVPAQRGLLRTYLKYEVVIEIELGRTKYYPAFPFRGGKIIDALAEINKAHATFCGDAHPTLVATALLDWWQTPHPGLPKTRKGPTNCRSTCWTPFPSRSSRQQFTRRRP
jgi:hypothetical protein